MPSRVDQLRRFERLGLKWNPFRVVIPSEKPDVYVPDLYKTAALAREIALSDSSFTQVIGRSGHGKSTFLAAVANELSEAEIPFQSIYLEPSLWTRVRVPQKDVRVLILDEAERLPRWGWRRSSLIRWVRLGGRLIVSTHRDLFANGSASSEFTHPVTVEFPAVTVVGLQQFFRTRLHWAGDDNRQFELTDEGGQWLLNISEGNLRVVEAILYEVFQVTANDMVSRPNSAPSTTAPMKIDTEKIEWLEVFGKRRAAFEADGDVPFSQWRLLAQSIRETTDRIVGWFSGRTSTPDPAERELPRSR